MFETLFTLLTTALATAQADWQNGYNGRAGTYDLDDQKYFYKCQLRAEIRLRDLGVRNFDVA